MYSPVETIKVSPTIIPSGNTVCECPSIITSIPSTAIAISSVVTAVFSSNPTCATKIIISTNGSNSVTILEAWRIGSKKFSPITLSGWVL